MRSFDKIPIAEFAKFLGTSRDTAKRLFQRNVLPEEWLEFSPGGKWFVRLDRERREEGRHLYERWKLLSRKPSASRSQLVVTSLSDDSLTLLSHRLLREAPNEENYEELMKALLGEGPEVEGDSATLRRYAALRSGLSHGDQQDDHDPAMWLLLVRLLEFRDRLGRHDVSPTPDNWAEMLHCSVASIYREPFGKVRLSKALKIADSFRPTIPSESPYGTSSVDRPEYLEDGFSFQARSKNSQSLDAGGKAKKRLRDSSRRAREKEMHFVWEMRRYPDRSLHLYLVPTLEAETVARYESENSRVTDKQFRRAKSEIAIRKRQIGCILEHGNLFECRFFIDSVHHERPPDSQHSTLARAIARLLRLARGVQHTTWSLDGDWERLQAEGNETWENPSQ